MNNLPGLKKHYRYIVVGCGGLGSAALYWLSKREGGQNVLGLEKFEIGHSKGASADHSRIIRLAYNSPDYTALTPATYACWRTVEADSGQQLVFRTGSIVFGSGKNPDIINYAKAMKDAGIPFEWWESKEAMKKYPQLTLKPGDVVVYQAEGGIVDPNKAVQTHISLARSFGATILDRTPVSRVIPKGKSGALVETSDGKVFTADKIVLCADAWTNQLLKSIGVAEYPLVVTQEQVTYHSTPNLKEFALERFPVWIWYGEKDNHPGCLYGFPIYGEVATKVGHHEGGAIVTADTRTFVPDQKVVDGLESFLKDYIPGSLGPVLYTKTCLYTLTPDRNFVIDKLPEYPQISIALGSGHAFKFASLIGLILSDLAIEGKTTYPIAPFSADRSCLKPEQKSKL